MRAKYAGAEDDLKEIVDTRSIDVIAGIATAREAKKRKKLTDFQNALNVDRVTRSRLRQRAGLRAVMIDVSDNQVSWLRRAGFLGEDVSRQAIGKAIAAVLADKCPLV